MRIVAGCDGGGTKCHVRVVVDDNSGADARTGEFISGPANVRSDPNGALQNIQMATREALLAADLPGDTQIDSFIAALAGAGDAECQGEWRDRIAVALPVGNVMVVPDVTILFAAADVQEGAEAVATIIGTGSIAWARAGDGRVIRAGGLGPLIGDEGSGFWIGREALRRLSRVDPSGLDSLLRDQMSVLDDHSDVTQIAGLASHIFRVAPSDSRARKIVEDAAEEIATLVAEATEAIQTSSDRQLRWVCAGGVAVRQRSWLQSIRDRCAARRVYLKPPVVITSPVDGAVKMASAR